VPVFISRRKMPAASNDDFFAVDWHNIAPFAGDFADFQDFEDVINVVLCIICVVCAGLAAGLTMGLLSLDVTKLEIKSMTGTARDKADAAIILPIVKQHHVLLCTLLLFNSLANEALPVFLDSLVPNWLAILLSVTLVLLFGEILPSAFFTGPAQLRTAASFVPFVKGLIAFFSPIAYPLSLGLDYFFGKEEEDSLISREELGALVTLQNIDRRRELKRRNSSGKAGLTDKLAKVPSTRKMPSNNRMSAPSRRSEHDTGLGYDDDDDREDDEEDNEGLCASEISIITGMLKLSKEKVKQHMLQMKEVFMISDSTRLDDEMLEVIWNKGHSRIPVYRRKDKQHILGYLLVKSLILVCSITPAFILQLTLFLAR
jgi:metal transporter CNNM